MKTIIRVTATDGSQQYISSTHPVLTYTTEENEAQKMEFAKAWATTRTLSAMGVPHSLITNSKWK